MKHPLQIIPEDFKNPIKLDRLLKTKPESYWLTRGERRVLNLFHLMARRVPAYKDFLKKNKINHLWNLPEGRDRDEGNILAGRRNFLNNQI